MADINMQMVKQLRELTGAGVLACKNALVANGGDMDKAVDELRKSGEAKAVKKANRIAAEGIVLLKVEGRKAAIVEVNSETDFVAKNEKFQAYAQNVLESVFASSAGTVEELKDEKWAADPSKTVEQARIEMVAMIGENITIRRFAKMDSTGLIIPYIHGGGRIGVLVEAQCEDNAANEEAIKNVAMQIAALSPRYVSRDDVDADYMAHETAILTEQAKNDPANAKKPDNIIEKMIQGRLNKELKEVCLLDQAYVKDGDVTVAKYLQSVGDIAIKSFIRFETGEGIEKKQEDFAAEVAAQMNM